MRIYKMAVALSVVSMLCLISSCWFYLSERADARYNQAKFTSIMRARAEQQAYQEKLDALEMHWKRLRELSGEQTANVSYDITLYPKNFGELQEKIVSTYAEGFFFLDRAMIQSTHEGIRLAVTGFRMGGRRP
ncbi:MAG: hypothetical protein QM299_06225 [Pseudomonadota bacterium]|jgi:hypothetical protein|uniref:Uncharacterized protein n=1 Tax=anaerobic digester metagenome TaxID=1263854 RepID=A0A485M275_9ZZZZ|nr:hypothetical protein [Pseudomonadota bacterium]HPD21836.1 hypothetical protein [Deltaproteobacteria bacterium]HPX17905.1 hypothetical protein [Deltaproteobacteria bacterium]